MVPSNSLPPAIILDGNQRAALATARSLGRRSVRVIVAESKSRSLAGASRFCAEELVYPDAARFPQAFADWLEGLGRRYPGAVLLPMTDLTVPLVLAAAQRLPSLRLGLPTLAAYESVTDKYSLYEAAVSLGVRVPQTLVVGHPDVEGLRERALSFPLAVKPRLSTSRVDGNVSKRPVRYAHDREQLLQIVAEELALGAADLLLQQYVEGHGAGVFGLYDQGRPLFFFSHRRLRERPPSGGVSVLSESIEPPAEALECARRILESRHWHGVAMVEFKVDPQGRCWLIEVNARFWGSLQLAVDSGADFPWFLYQLATGTVPQVPDRFTPGRRLRWWLGDLDSLYSQLRRPLPGVGPWGLVKAAAAFALPWTPGLRYELFRWNDPWPAYRSLRQYVQALAGKS